MSSPKEFNFPETIPEEASSVEEERVVIFRLPSSSFKPSIYTAADASLFQQSQERIDEERRTETRFDFDKIHRYSDRRSEKSSTEKDSDDESIHSQPSIKYDTTAATFLDIAVLRCLFILHWQEEGVYWCLHYIYNR